MQNHQTVSDISGSCTWFKTLSQNRPAHSKTCWFTKLELIVDGEVPKATKWCKNPQFSHIFLLCTQRYNEEWLVEEFPVAPLIPIIPLLAPSTGNACASKRKRGARKMTTWIKALHRLDSIPRTYMVEGKIQLLKVVLRSPEACYNSHMHTALTPTHNILTHVCICKHIKMFKVYLVLLFPMNTKGIYLEGYCRNLTTFSQQRIPTGVIIIFNWNICNTGLLRKEWNSLIWR